MNSNRVVCAAALVWLAGCTGGSILSADVDPDAEGSGLSDGGGSADADAGVDITDGAPAECGDGTRQPEAEVCDDGNTADGDGCAADCLSMEDGFACPTPGEACVRLFECGNGILEPDEQCDDQNLVAGDGCDDSCVLESGWTCPVPGLACEAAECGDGILAGNEECDDGDASSPGCSDECKLEDGYACDTPGEACVETLCGDEEVEGTEECDDGNTDLGDGCDPFCRREPVCEGGTCQAFCGDELIQDGEDCDDGNVRDGDGCSSECELEDGFTCDEVAGDEPETFVVPIVYRDFRGNDLDGGHPDFQNHNGAETGIVEDTLGDDGKPVYAGNPTTDTTAGQESFDQWYRDTPGTNVTVVDELVLDRTSEGTYVFDSGAFFPLDERGWVASGDEPLREDADGDDRNFHFTSELRYWFEYEGDEELSFRGDDDVWVFINERLAIDLGGVHGALDGSITLDADAAQALDLQLGGIYEVVVFQAERHTSRSSYKLTLSNFQTARSECTSECGDGIRTPDEVCDDGDNNGDYGSCTPDCKAYGPRCGDGEVQEDHEQCDDGINDGAYGDDDGCTPTCELPGHCGDGIIQDAYEQCDDGNDDPNDGCHQCKIVIE